MAFKDALDTIPTSGRTHVCRICQIIDEWPEDDANALAEAARQPEAFRVVDALPDIDAVQHQLRVVVAGFLKTRGFPVRGTT